MPPEPTRSSKEPLEFAQEYERQYYGDYSRWSERPGRVIVLDNLSADSRTLDYVTAAAETFDQVIVAVSSATFYAYYHDHKGLASFRRVYIEPLTHAKQEELIRLRLGVSEAPPTPHKLDGKVDQMENRVNAIIMHNRVVPRYPFYVLSILQTHEGFLQTQIEITSHSHCYYVLILSHLAKSGVDMKDDEINSCFNFAEHLAFERRNHGTEEDSGDKVFDFEDFVARYLEEYIITDATLARLRSEPYGLLTGPQSVFRSPYMQYFFLGRFLAKNVDCHRDRIAALVERSHITSNYLTLMFTIHHTDDTTILDDILSRTKRTLPSSTPASLDREETRMFGRLIAEIPKTSLSENSVPEERKNERLQRDRDDEEAEEQELEEDDPVDTVNDVFRTMKNNDVLGQILKSKYGVLRRRRLSEIAETIADGGLRIVSLLVGREEEIKRWARLSKAERPQLSLERVERALHWLVFEATMMSVRRVVGALNGPEIQEVTRALVEEKDTPAYDLVGYYLRLETTDGFTRDELEALKSLLRKHSYPFMQSVVSFRTQRYLNTHNVPVRMEQAVCAELGIKYRRRLKGE